MNILLPTVDYPPQQGGVARYLHAIKETFPNNVEVLYWNMPIGRWEMFREILSFSSRYRQIWTSHILPIGTMVLLVSFLKRKPYTIFLHGMDFDLARRNRWKRFISKRILKKAAHVVVNSQALKEEVQAFCGAKSIMVVYPTVADTFLKEAQSFSFQDKHIHENSPVKLLTVSRLVERKGHEHVLMAIKDMENVQYTIVGEGPFSAAIRRRIKDLGLQHRVKMLGAISDEKIIEMYKTHDIFVMPTKKTPLDREGFGIVYLEAQLFYLPVIASNHAGVNEAVMHRKTGILVNDIHELRSALHELASDRDLCHKMGKQGREFVLQNFTREKQFSKLKEILSYE